jgi:hypothetical protein
VFVVNTYRESSYCRIAGVVECDALLSMLLMCRRVVEVVVVVDGVVGVVVGVVVVVVVDVVGRGFWRLSLLSLSVVGWSACRCG